MGLNKKFSLIIPVYNVEIYIARCLDSVLNQDIPMSEYEIIVVNDGSTDRSATIVEQYARKYSNLIVINKENGGLSSARNAGLRKATGEYVWFIDSDDFICKDVLKDIYKECINNQLDVLRIKWQRVDIHENILPPLKKGDRGKGFPITSGLEFVEKRCSTYLFAWSFIYKHAVLLKSNILFKEGLLYEDVEFNVRILPLIDRIKSFNKVCYCYTVNRRGSILNKIDSKRISDLLIVCDTIKTLSKQSDLSFYKRILSDCVISAILLTASSSQMLKESGRDFLWKLSEFGINHLLYTGTLPRKILCFVFNVSPVLSLYVAYILNLIRSKR
ncbi:glycosyltransferase [Bacteroides gallinaceum]|uniref:glycosyltransferase n=1 Tax=Bacteroides gallinaceum TaxID=1462571 RepID=UPI00195AA5E3|nr:glycosyltransferase [Bacteroides gallinaceum]MBM6721150.1 glycosyltransferase [Bacteroides gallinaceum]